MVKKYTNLGVFAVAFVGLASCSWFPPPSRGQDPAPSNTTPAANQPPAQPINPTRPWARFPITSGPRHTSPSAGGVSSTTTRIPIQVPTTTMTPPAFATRAASAGTPSTIRPATASRSREIPCAWPSSAWAATPARRIKGPPSRSASHATIRIQRHIDNYAMPRYGYGFGVGGFGGFW